MADTPRPYDDSFIESQVLAMYKARGMAPGERLSDVDIAGWFARWGYEEGKFDMLTGPIAAKDERVQFLEAALKSGVLCKRTKDGSYLPIGLNLQEEMNNDN